MQDDEDIDVTQLGRVGCIGAGREGLLSTAVLSRAWLNTVFCVYDRDIEKINNLNGQNDQHQMRLPFWEPGGWNLVTECINNNNLIFSSDPTDLDACKLIFIAVDIPSVKKPMCVKKDLQASNLEEAIVMILESVHRNPVASPRFLAIKSTIPLDHQEHLNRRFERYAHYQDLRIVVNPDFFSDGSAVADLLNPRSIVFGPFGNTLRVPNIFRALVMPLVEGNPDRIEMLGSANAAELGKLLSNACILAQLTVMNIGSSISGRVHCSFDDVRRSYRANPRINGAFTRSRPGYGGAGLVKDINYLIFLCENSGLREESQFFSKLMQLRKKKMNEFVCRVLSMVGNDKIIAVYGFANKERTDDTRESPAIHLCNELLKANGIQLVIYDRLVGGHRIRSCFPRGVQPRIRIANGLHATWPNTQIVILLVRSGAVRVMLENQLDAMLTAMAEPKMIIDCCGLVNPAIIAALQGRAVLHRLGYPQ